MPRGDRTGPMGEGPMTGRAAGYCGGNDSPGFANPAPGGFGMGYGRGYGYGRGLGFRRGFFGGRGRGGRGRFYGAGFPGRAPIEYAAPVSGPSMTRDQELMMLKGQADSINAALEDIRRRIEELEAGD